MEKLRQTINNVLLFFLFLLLPTLSFGQAPTCEPIEETSTDTCSDGVDNDGNNIIDCQEQECAINQSGCSKTVFITSGFMTGNFGSIDDADQICDNVAQNAGLNPGTYLAWISSGTSSPSTRFTRSTVPYLLTNTNRIADDWDDLINCTEGPNSDECLENSINYDEDGVLLTSGLAVWSNTQTDGTSLMLEDCDGWTSISDSARIGSGSSNLSFWTVNGGNTFPCNESRRLYCFQQ